MKCTSGRRAQFNTTKYTAVSRKIVQQVPYATMPKVIMGNGGSWSLIEDLGVSAT